MVAGNHDGLLCSQEDCISCTTLCVAGRKRWPLSNTREKRFSLNPDVLRTVFRNDTLSENERRRLHNLDHSYVDIEFPGHERSVRVFGSAWTPRFHVGGAQHFTHTAAEGNSFDLSWWTEHWNALAIASDSNKEDRPQSELNFF